MGKLHKNNTLRPARVDSEKQLGLNGVATPAQGVGAEQKPTDLVVNPRHDHGTNGYMILFQLSGIFKNKKAHLFSPYVYLLTFTNYQPRYPNTANLS